MQYKGGKSFALNKDIQHLEVEESRIKEDL